MNAEQIKAEIAARKQAREKAEADQKELESQLEKANQQAASEQLDRERKAAFLLEYQKKQAEALNAPTLDVRDKWLRWAAEAKSKADAINLPEDANLTESELENNQPITQSEQSWNLLEIAKQFKISAIAFTVFAVGYWLSQLVEYTIPSYLLEQLSKLSYVVFLASSTIALTFLIMHRYFPILMDYLNQDRPSLSIEADFTLSTPAAAVRLLFFWLIFMGIASLLLIAMSRAGLT